MPLGDACAQGIAGLRLTVLDDGSLEEPMVRQLDRALKWIDRSITEFDLEEQTVQLCTAMETLLLPGYTGPQKGQLMALRYHLLGGRLHPAGILGDYEDRSDALHSGAARHIDGYRVWLLRLEVFVTLRHIINLAAANPAARSLADLVPLYETTGSLRQFIDLCDQGVWGRRGIGEVRKTAEKRLKELTGKGQ